MRSAKHLVFDIALLLLVGCVPGLDEFEAAIEAGPDQGQTVSVRFDVGKVRSLKSSISPREDVVENLNLYAFCDGKLVVSEYFEMDSRISLKLLYGQEYNLYALANVGQVESPVDESRFGECCVAIYGCMEDIGDLVPMAWKTEGFVVGSPADRVSVCLDRLISKIIFSVDKTELKGLEINSVRLCQSPLKVWPFRNEDGSFVEDAGDVSDGDYASDDDLDMLNSGQSICFYMLENCQGKLLDGNSDPWQKVPENISAKSGLCTYLELGCTFRPGYFYSGDITYRLYLGQDSFSDFNIRRNTVLNVTFFLTDDALGRVSWRVEADVDVNGGYVGGWLSRGLHGIDDLYMGEKFVYTLEMEQEMMEHLDWDAGNATLCSLGADGNENAIMEFGALRYMGASDGNYHFEVDGLCRAAGEGVLCLKDCNGKNLAVLDDVLVQKPQLLVSEFEYVDPGATVEGMRGVAQYTINGPGAWMHVYAVDNDCYNLNSSESVGFDLSLFNLQHRYAGIDGEIGESLDFDIVEGEEGCDGPLLSSLVRSINKGTYYPVSERLMEAVSSNEIGLIWWYDEDAGISADAEFCVDNMVIALRLVDNGWAGYADTQLSLLIDNPSMLPINVNCWQLNQAKDGYNAVSRNEIVDQYLVTFSRDVYDYVCGSYSQVQLPMYCSHFTFDTDKSGNFPLLGIDTYTIYNALLYDYMTQNALYHQIDVSFANGMPIYGLTISNELSDGSMEYGEVYGSSGWNDRGIWLYSANRLRSNPRSDFDSLIGVTPKSLQEISSGMGRISVSFNSGSKNFCACVSEAELAGLQLNTEIVIKASGYVQTTPNGTWGKKVDNYCSAQVSKEVTDVVLGQDVVYIDGNAVKEAMNAIYAKTFTDSKNLIGSSDSYAHRAHPTSLEISLRFSLSGSSASMMVPISVSSPSSVSFYHTQEGVNYSVSIKTTKKTNRVGIVDML